MNRNCSELTCLSLLAALATLGCGARSSLDDTAWPPASDPEAGEGGAGGSSVSVNASSSASASSGASVGVGGSAPVCEAGCLSLDFARQFDRAEPNGLAVDAQGNILVTGYFDGTVDFGGGPLVSTGNGDAFVLKLDPLGNHVWSRRFGDLSHVIAVQAGLTIAADASGNILVGGRFGGTTDFGGGPVIGGLDTSGFLVLLDASGQHVWSKHFGTESTTVRGAGFHPAGGIIVAGDYWGTVDLGGGPFTSGGPQSVFAARLDASGGHLWSQSFGGLEGANLDTLALDAAGNIALAGSFHDTIDFGGGSLHVAEDSAHSASVDVFVASLGPGGEHRWSERLGGASADDHFGTAVDGAGSVITLGFFDETLQFGGDTLTSDGDAVFVTKHSAGGAPGFARSFSRAQALAADAAGNTWLTGAIVEETDFGCGPLAASPSGLFVAGLGPQGDAFCSVSFEPSEYGGLSRVALDPAGALVMVGNLKGTIDFGAGPITSPATKESMIVVKLIP